MIRQKLKLLEGIKEKREIYLAGFFDGQGNVYYNFLKDSKGRTKFNVAFYQSGNKKEVNEIANIIRSLGMKVSIYGMRRSKKAKKKEYQIYITNRKDSEEFLRAILPYLILKKKQVKIALEKFNSYKRKVGKRK